MAALSEEGRYRVSCGRDGSATSVLHVKLTETVYRALKNYQNSKNASSSRPTIQFKGQQGSIKIPCADDPASSASFDFFVSRVGKDGPQGSFECVRQHVSGKDMPHLSCLGVVQDRVTLCASTSHDLQQRPPLAETGARKPETKAAKPADGPSTGKRVPFRKPAPSSSPSDLVPERKRSTPINPATLLRKGPPNPPVSQARYRDRVVHLLALRPHKKLAVLARLQRDKINPKDLGSTLQQVANLNPKDNTFSLKDHLYRDVRRDWPGYTQEEREQLEHSLASKFGTQCESPSTKSPKEPIPTAQQKGYQEISDFIDPLMPKKSRISHIGRVPTTPPPSESHAPSKEDKPPRPAPHLPASNPPPAPHVPASNPPLPLSSRSPSTPEGCGTQALPVDAQSSRVDQSRSSTRTPSPALEQGARGGGKKPKKRSKKRRQREESAHPPNAKIHKSDREEGTDAPVRSIEVTSTDVTPDYLHKYAAVTSVTQRQSYKDDFNAEYGEYCSLHARVEKVTRHFTRLDSQCKQLQPGTKEHKEVQEEVLQEYHRMKGTSPSYREMKHRCEYLHNKLAHIKHLIAAFDRQRTPAWDYSDTQREGGAIAST